MKESMQFRRNSSLKLDMKKIVESKEGILDIVQKKSRAPIYDKSLTYKFIKTQNIYRPKKIIEENEGKLERITELVQIYFPQRVKYTYCTDLHHDFMADFQTIYYNEEQDSGEEDKINDFTPETWARLSNYKSINKIIDISSDSIKVPDKKKSIASIIKSDSSPLIAKKIKDIFKKLQKQECTNTSDDNQVLPHGLAKLSRKTQQNYDRILSILLLQPITKSDQALLNSTLRHVGAFQKLTDSVFERLCSCIKVEIIPAKNCIFKQEDPGNCWYIILLGYVRIKVTQDSKESTVGILGPGEGFGEQAILTDSNRAASAYSASSPTVVARIDKSDYRRVMNFIRQLDKKEKIFFLKYMKLLSKFDEIALRNLADRITLRKFEAGKCLIQESEICNSVYFIKSGSASVYKKLIISPTKTKEILVGKVYRGDSVNEDVLLNRSNYTGSLVTVIADEPIEFGAVLAYEDLERFPFSYTRPDYLNYYPNDLLKLNWVQENVDKFRQLQARLVTNIKVKAGGNIHKLSLDS